MVRYNYLEEDGTLSPDVDGEYIRYEDHERITKVLEYRLDMMYGPECDDADCDDMMEEPIDGIK